MTKRVALIGAWGYGNVGDDAYPQVWRHYLPGVEFTAYNSDLPREIPLADLYLFGGGGILFDNGTAHFEYMSAYVKWAEQAGIPVAFSSVGVQARLNIEDETRSWCLDEALARWPDVLRRAVLITVRDPSTQALLAARGIASQFYPDVCHLTPGLETQYDHFITVIPGPGCSLNFRDFRAALDEKLTQHPDTPLVILTTGAPEHDFLVDELAFNYPVMATFKSRYVDVDLSLAVVRSSRFIFTGRYHGMVFARAAGKPFWRSAVMHPYKMQAEDLSVPLKNAFGHVQRVAQLLDIEPEYTLPANLSR